ncbi:MAG TPA: hypothetical protein PLM79_17900 [Syntrophobacteraceae bacterium]|nr:hypothetical protein [Syntrophobacteraceae bacterium]
MMIMHLSKHFRQRWRARVSLGDPPCLDEVNEILRRSVRIRNQIRLWKMRGRKFVPHRVLAEYWYHPGGLILKIDETNRTAVTVITAAGRR